MPSTFTTSGVELIADGEQSGAWGQTTNLNLQIIDRMISQAGTITLSGTTHTLTVSNGALSDGQYNILVFAGSPSGTNTITISPNTAQRTFTVRNTTAETIVLTQGSGGNVTIPSGGTTALYCDGAGAGAAVINVTPPGVPSGAILAWSGSIANIPAGFVICDGTNSTPDLRDRFIVGAGTTYAVDATGGANTVALTTAEIAGHTHTVSGTTASDGAHTHNVSGNTSNTGAHTHNVSGNTSNTGAHTHTGSTSNTGAHTHPGRSVSVQPDANSPAPIVSTAGIQSNSPRSFVNRPADFMNSAGAHSHNFTTDSDGAHSHTVSGTAASDGAHSHTLSGTADSAGAHTHTFSATSGSTGGGSAHENRPPYYALAYIMKT
jgi:microcystin-dependent protein